MEEDDSSSSDQEDNESNDEMLSFNEDYQESKENKILTLCKEIDSTTLLLGAVKRAHELVSSESDKDTIVAC